MLARLVMHCFGWSDVWFTGGISLYGPAWFARIPHRTWRSLKSAVAPGRAYGSVFVGRWTGPQHDLICIRECSTNEEAERWLSPPARTITGAALKSAWKRLRLDRADPNANRRLQREIDERMAKGGR